jgi:heme oxygenase
MDRPIPFSTALRERSSTAHSGSEGADFMSDLMEGDGTREDYIALAVQHWYIYDALERAVDRMRHDPVASVFITDNLTRIPSLEADLDFLIGHDWQQRISPLPTTQRYVDRIDLVGHSWPGGFVAHHYTRYLGDLSGGQFVGRLMGRRFGLETNGIRFYVFDDIADVKAFKDVYREHLDAAPWDAAEQDRIIDEVLLAYRFNTQVFTDLAVGSDRRESDHGGDPTAQMANHIG